MNKDIKYKFVPVPINLMACLDVNCRSLLFNMIQLSSYYAEEDGWFYRTNEDLRYESGLGEKVIRACISTLHRIGVLDVKSVGYGKSKTPNKFRINSDKFEEWDKLSIENCFKNPEYKITTDDYKSKGWVPSYLNRVDVKTTVPQVVQSADNINNIDNKNNNILYEHSAVENKTISKKTEFDEYKRQEDYLMDKLFHVTNWTDFTLYRKQVEELLSTAKSDKVAKRTMSRFTPISEGKIKLFKSKLSKEPYQSFYDDFYRETGCGWLGKENTTEENKRTIQDNDNSIESQQEDETAEMMRNFYVRMGMAIP